jgi:hypothetical protein
MDEKVSAESTFSRLQKLGFRVNLATKHISIETEVITGYKYKVLRKARPLNHRPVRPVLESARNQKQ